MAMLMLVIGPSVAAAKPVHHPVSVRIDTVLAADTDHGFDERLERMRRPLLQLFHYSTYQRLSHEEKKTECGRVLIFSLPGGRILHVEPRSIEGNMIELEVMLFQGEQPRMTTDFFMMNRGMLLLGGPRYKQGMLIISIGAEAPLPPSPPRQPHPHPHVTIASPLPSVED